MKDPEIVNAAGLGTVKLLIVVGAVTVGPVSAVPANVTLNVSTPLFGTCSGDQFVAVPQFPATGLVQSELMAAPETVLCGRETAANAINSRRVK